MHSLCSSLSDSLAPVVQSLGFVLYGVERWRSGRGDVVRVYIDHARGVNIDDCARVSSSLAPVLSDMVASYEVSSPGIDRPLFTPGQLRGCVGSPVFLRTSAPLSGRRRFSGVLHAVTATSAEICVDAVMFTVPLDLIVRAQLRGSGK